MKNGSNLIGRKHKVFIYQKKQGTKAAHYLVSGEDTYLPRRLSLDTSLFRVPKNVGSKVPAGQMKGEFTKAQESVYKIAKPYRMHSTIWKLPEAPYLMGWADVGISKASGKTEATGDLLLVKRQGVVVEIHLFQGMVGKIDLALTYFETWLKLKRKG